MNFDSIMTQTRVKEDFKNILMIDVSHLATKQIFGIAAGQKKNGLTQEEIYKMWRSSMISNIMDFIIKFSANQVIIAYDNKIGGYWRSKFFPEYKSHRKELSARQAIVDWDEFNPIKSEFFKLFKHSFNTLHHIDIKGVEADDICAIISKNYCNDNNITIVTSDQDYKQLIKYPNVQVYDAIKRKMMVSADPKKDLMQKILVGDSSDNIPNIKKGKCGPKTAHLISNIGLEKWIENNPKFTEEEVQDINSKYELNKKLIDMDFIPSDIERQINEQYTNYKLEKFNLKKHLAFVQKFNLDYIGDQLLGNMSQILFELK